VVNDFHDSQRNLPIEQMNPRAEYEVGYGTMMPALTPDFAAVLVLGMHAKSGTPRAFLEHSVDPEWHRYWINGDEHGEFALITFTAAASGVPTVFVAGDRAAIEEARALVPAIETCVVKGGLACDWCRSLAPAVAHEQIHTGVARALTRRQEVVSPVLARPATVRLEFNRCQAGCLRMGRASSAWASWRIMMATCPKPDTKPAHRLQPRAAMFPAGSVDHVTALLVRYQSAAASASWRDDRSTDEHCSCACPTGLPMRPQPSCSWRRP
jgi:hypothetical protein